MKDTLGIDHHFDRPPRRVVSLVPSITETLFDLGAGDVVVGVTDWCIFPGWLQGDDDEAREKVPRLGGTKNPDVDAIRELEPDLVHMNLEENLAKHADAIRAFAPVFVTEPKSPHDVVGLLRDLGRIHGCQASASAWIARLEDELKKPPVPSFTFACPIWKKPWMWCGGDTYVSALVESIGGVNVSGDEVRYPTHDVADVAALRPDVIFLPDEPYAFTEADVAEVQEMFRCRVVGPFPGHLFTWHGTRTLLGLRALREWIG